MGFFDDVVNTGKGAIDTTVKFTGDVIASQKLRYRMASLRSQISKDFETLGIMYFDAKTNVSDNEEAMMETMKGIEEKEQQLAELESQVDGCKTCRTCAFCGTKNPQDAAFCNKCGKKL